MPLEGTTTFPRFGVVEEKIGSTKEGAMAKVYDRSTVDQIELEPGTLR
jgi:hypothetical protein